ncbi:MAG: glutamate--tRNA ligase [Euryarchaeota archaeon]|nr:glutamate--tRNA ligase [Euryarchaeota archaeon]
MIKKHVLINALDYDGKANPKAVLGKVLAEDEKLKEDIAGTIKKIEEIVEEINSLSGEEQTELLKEIYPTYFEKTKKKKKRELPDLSHSGRVITRLPPEPNGYLHLGHGLSFFFNWYYARKYNGKLILRFEDTNPSKEKKEFYEKIKEDLHWLGIDWDLEKRESESMERYYHCAEEMIRKGEAYLCTCSGEKIHKDRFEKRECGCRERSAEENLRLFNLLKKGETEGILRLKGDMQSENTAMRDPTLFRINLDSHPIVGKKYKLWPLYDFACAIEDAEVTHVLRDNEFQLRVEVQNYIRECLGLDQPFIRQYSRFNVKGTPTSKRKIRPLIADGTVEGWDDVRLATVRGLCRRGIIPKTVHELGKELGLSTAEPVIDWTVIEAINRKLIDPVAKRFFFVEDPTELIVKNAPERVVELPMHPTEDLGKRRLKVGNRFFVPPIKENEVRLKDLYNITIAKRGKRLAGEYLEGSEEEVRDIRKIQWVPEEHRDVEILVPGPLFENDELNPESLRTIHGIAEKTVEFLDEGDIIQFERFGFCRLDKKGKVYRFVFTHR